MTEDGVTGVALVPEDVVRRVLGERLRIEHPVADLTTYRVGGRARYFFVADSIVDLERVGHLRRTTGIAVVVIGRGSNVLFADRGYPGLVLQLGEFAMRVGVPDSPMKVSSGNVDVGVGGAAALPVVARRTAAAGLRGFEWAVGVPGTIGGGVRMNAGGHGSDMATSLRSVDLFDLERGEARCLGVAELGLRFRGSNLSDAEVVTGAVLGLDGGSAVEALAEIDEVVRWRRANQPGGQNAGSVFVNPVPHELSAGELIDRCGLRGYRKGSAHVSDKHANFIQSDPGGTAADVVAVMRHVRRVVLGDTGHALRAEIRLLGFDEGDVSELREAKSAPGQGAAE